MKNPNPRRHFIGKLVFAAASVITLPILSFTKNKDKATSPTGPKKEPIRSVQRMGFQWDTYDPFIFCVHHEDFFPKGNAQCGPDVSLKGRQLGDDFIIKDGFRMYHGKTVPGFPGHPHRGFETVTVVRKGLVDHADSLGAAGRYGNGDVQWMTAGKGVQHSEMFPLLKSESENPLELFQIWLNLPKKNKMVDAHFKMLWKENLPILEHKDEQGNLTKIEIIAGQIKDLKAPEPPPNSWAFESQNEVAIWNIKLSKNAKYKLPKASAGINRTLYFYEGTEIKLANTSIPNYHSVIVESDMEIEIVNGDHDSSILILQGKPINEPVVQYGPFVMNTKEEIMQAYEDFNKTRFGGWPWPKYDQVHDKSKGRFAKHADGRVETRG
jgi:redox-sensitive bicupin YhaK (pirin superfamily)